MLERGSELPRTPIEAVAWDTANKLAILYQKVTNPDILDKEEELIRNFSPLEKAVYNLNFVADELSPIVEELYKRRDLDGLILNNQSFWDQFKGTSSIEYHGWGLYIGQTQVQKPNFARIPEVAQNTWDLGYRSARKKLTEFGNMSKGHLVYKFSKHVLRGVEALEPGHFSS